jgi:hypothetical protein
MTGSTTPPRRQRLAAVALLLVAGILSLPVAAAWVGA